MNFYFHLFALLIALRDVWSSLLLKHNIAPMQMLFYFCMFTSLYTFLIAAKDDFGRIFRSFFRYPKKYLLLGLLTSIAFASMIYGFSVIGASLFTTIEHGLIPFFTFFFGIKMLEEKMDRNHLIGIIFSVIGIQLVFVPGIQSINGIVFGDYLIGVMLGIVCSILTAYTSIQQKELVDKSEPSFIILFWRFFFPTVGLGSYLLFSDQTFHYASIPQISLVALIGFTLPLFLLLKGFVSSTMIKFSIFNLLIPLYTITLALVIHPEDLNSLLNIYSMSGAVLVMLGFSISENFFNLFMSRGGAAYES